MFVKTESLSKRYGPVSALTDCSFTASAGEVVGLLGPNGAGKTTLLRLLLGFLKPTRGKALIAGLDCYREPLRVHRRLSYLPGDARLFRQLDGAETLRFFSRLRSESSIDRALRIADRLQLDLTRRVRQMSTGMRQKLALAVALSPDVPLLVLDEPTSNLDPTVRRDVIDLIREAPSERRIVIFSSHVLSEVEQACDRAIVLRSGRLVDDLQMSHVKHQHRIRARLTGPMPSPPPELAGELTIDRDNRGAVTMLTPGDLAPLLGWLATLPLEELRVEPLGLGAIYEKHHPTGE
ncbi:MAG: ABC transporter ATP-binding protein [Planctomycetota bacterium]